MVSPQFQLRICTPRGELFSGLVTEAILPGLDGEVGVLAGHKNFIGLLGTGVLKLVRDGDDYWFMLSVGVFEMRGGALTVLAEIAEPASEINNQLNAERVKELEGSISSMSSYLDDYAQLKVEYDRASARLEAYRRTHLVN